MHQTAGRVQIGIGERVGRHAVECLPVTTHRLPAFGIARRIAVQTRGIAELARSLRNQGRAEMNSWLTHERLGYNYRMDDRAKRIGELIEAQKEIDSWLTDKTLSFPDQEWGLDTDFTDSTDARRFQKIDL